MTMTFSAGYPAFGSAGATITMPEPVCKMHGQHRYRCEAVTDKLVVVMVCECGSVIRDYPKEDEHAKT